MSYARRAWIVFHKDLLVDRPAADLSGAELHRLYESLTDGTEN